MEDLFNVGRSVTELYKIWIAAGGALLALGWAFFPNRKVAVQLLIGLTIVAGLNYARWGDRLLLVKVDVYDLMHYYVNAKYYSELGYYDLYPAVMLVDHENAGPYHDEGSRYLSQDENGHSFQPIAHALARGRVVKAEKFTEASWKAFTHDVLYLQRTITPAEGGFQGKLWRQMIQDHGFNGTPAWVALARPLTLIFPVEWIKVLCYVDLALLAVAMALLHWAYGGQVWIWATFFMLVSYSLRWPTVTWSYLRYDWISGLLIAMALLKKGRPFLGGIFAGYAAVLRFFPALWMWGPFSKGVAGLARGKLHRQLLVLAGGFLLGAALLQGAAVAYVGSKDTVVHFENMMDHNSAEQLSSRRIGLALALAFQGPSDPAPKYIEKERKRKVERQKPVRYSLAFLFMVVMGWALRRADDDEAFGYGFLPFFLLTTASYYYYIARVTLAVVHAADLEKRRNQVGLAMLFGLEVFSNWADTAWDGHRVFLIGYLSWGLALYAVVMAGWMLWDARKADLLEAAEQPSEAS